MDDAGGRVGRPRSEQAREAVLNAVDDLLVEVGYAAMTMKGIAERAGVGRQTVYRWWSTKAEILFEASVTDAEEELTLSPQGSPLADLSAYLESLVAFLTRSPAGAAYRALLAAAQHDTAVAELVASRNPLSDSARVVLGRIDAEQPLTVPLDWAAAQLVGPTFFWVLTGRDPAVLDARATAQVLLRELSSP